VWGRTKMTLSNTWYPHLHMIRFYSIQIKEKSIVPKDMKFLNSEGQPKAYRSSIFYRSKKMNGSMQSFRFPNIMRTNTCSLRHAMVFPSGRNFPNLPTSVKAVSLQSVFTVKMSLSQSAKQIEQKISCWGQRMAISSVSMKMMSAQWGERPQGYVVYPYAIRMKSFQWKYWMKVCKCFMSPIKVSENGRPKINIGSPNEAARVYSHVNLLMDMSSLLKL